MPTHRSLIQLLTVLILWLAMAPGVSDAEAGTQDEEALRRVLQGRAARSFSAGFIRDSLPLDGNVSQTTGDSQITGNRRLLGNGDTLYVTLVRPDEIAPGDLLTIYRQRHKVYHPISGEYLGYLFSIRGIGRVRKIEGTTAVLKVLGGYDAISPGDGVMRFVPPPPATAEEATVVAGVGTLVDIEPPRSLIAQRHLVYLDWGHRQGLRLGSQLKVFRVGGGLPSRDIAELQVVAVEERTATAEVLRSFAPLVRGDRFSYQSGTFLIGEPEGGAAALPPGTPPTTVAKATPPPLELEREGTRLTINLDDLVDQLEYESGEATVRPEGLEILKQVHALLVEMPPQQITVEGHADNVPIGPSLRAQFPSNQELSQARADLVVRYLLEHGGLDRERIRAIGFADTKPVAPNDSEAGRRKNRRIEIVLTPLSPEVEGPIRLPEPEPEPEETTPLPAPTESTPTP